jgi:hypothetical protein
MSEKIYLGVNRNGDSISLYKHKFDCGWYWGFGYVGNRNLHYHLESMIRHPQEYCERWTDVTYQFQQTWITQSQWWILRDLFIQAYAIKKCAETYKLGGYQTSDAGPYRVISEEMATRLNADLGQLLDTIWDLLKNWRKEALDKNPRA